ncbi:MAG: NusA-like transcription termination signal-binding factor [Candidatus Aenigmatarchaeota archaeon]
MRDFSRETIELMNIFSEITNVDARDCISGEDRIYFLVEPGKAGLAIGKNGKSIKKLQKALNKRVKVFEYSEDEKDFVKSMIPEAKNINIKDDKAIVKISKKDRGKVIGKGGSNIKKVREFIKRNSVLEGLDIR